MQLHIIHPPSLNFPIPHNHLNPPPTILRLNNSRPEEVMLSAMTLTHFGKSQIKREGLGTFPISTKHHLANIPLILTRRSRRILQDIQQTLFQRGSKVVIHIRAVLPLALIVLSESIQVDHDYRLWQNKKVAKSAEGRKKLHLIFSVLILKIARKEKRSSRFAERSDDAEAEKDSLSTHSLSCSSDTNTLACPVDVHRRR